MKKTFLAALVALLVMMAVVSCDNQFSGDKPEYTADGRELVTLSIDTSVGGASTAAGRSLTDALARSEANWVEVIFRSGDGSIVPYTYYRAAGMRGLPLLVKVPADDYREPLKTLAKNWKI